MQRTAVIDLGSNTFRLVVFEAERGRWWKKADEVSTASASGAGQNGGLQPEPVARALEALALYGHFCRARGIEDVRPVATSAIREAENRDEFLARAPERSGARSACSRARRRRTTATSPRSTRPR